MNYFLKNHSRLFTTALAVCLTATMFAGCQNLSQLDMSTWDVSAVEDMTGMFNDCVALSELPEWYE